MRRNVSPTVFLTLLIVIGVFTLTNDIRKVGAEGTIYIRPDGSIDPPTAPIQRDGNVYAFTDDIYEKIVVQTNDVVIDGKCYSLQGSGSGSGFDLSRRNNVTVRNTRITGWNYGIHLYNVSTESAVINNNFTNNVVRGIFLSNSSGNTISRNKVVNNLGEGLFLWRTNTTTIIGNNVSNNGEDGISIGYLSFNNTIINNSVSHNSWAGIALGYEVPIPVNNTITGNNITNNGWAGIYIDHMNGNTFYHNNILYNTGQLITVEAINAWDDGYAYGGNYWSDYTGVDLSWGPYQNKIGSDGIADAPRIIDGSNRDNYPLMSPYEYWSNPIPGDINRDTKVDNNDLSQLAIAYGSTPEKPNWNPNSDINSNNIVNVLDLFRLGKNFGEASNTVTSR